MHSIDGQNQPSRIEKVWSFWGYFDEAEVWINGVLIYNVKIDTAKYSYLIEARDKVKCLRGTASINQLNKAVQSVLDPQCLTVDWSGPVQPMDLQDNWKGLSNWFLAGPVQWLTPCQELLLKWYLLFRAARPLSEHLVIFRHSCFTSPIKHGRFTSTQTSVFDRWMPELRCFQNTKIPIISFFIFFSNGILYL